jgi:uncharacterized protein (DUF433 family)
MNHQDKAVPSSSRTISRVGDRMSDRMSDHVGDPRDAHKAPCFVNTEVPIKRLFDYLKAKQSLDIFLQDFPAVARTQALAVMWLDEIEAGTAKYVTAEEAKASFQKLFK